MLTLKNLTVTADKKKILKNFSAQFGKGKIYAVMGPNGSGKSTFARTVMGDPNFTPSKTGTLSFNGTNIKNLAPVKRAHAGIFLSFQSPLALAGVNVFQLLRVATNKKEDQKLSAKELKEKIESIAAELKIPEELLRRPLNEDFSGGERKKMEVLQAAVLDPELLILDEIDTGVDVDALKTITTFLKKFSKGKTLIIITHYNRILKYLAPDDVFVIKDGALVKKGSAKLAREIEKKGYDHL